MAHRNRPKRSAADLRSGSKLAADATVQGRSGPDAARKAPGTLADALHAARLSVGLGHGDAPLSAPQMATGPQVLRRRVEEEMLSHSRALRETAIEYGFPPRMLDMIGAIERMIVIESIFLEGS